jgi:hypothetical protein
MAAASLLLPPKELKKSEAKFYKEQTAYEKKLAKPALGFVERQHQVMYADFQIYISIGQAF